MLLEKKQNQQSLFQQAVDWVQREARARNLAITINSEMVEERQGDRYTFIRIPVKMKESEGYDFAKALVILEDTWNDREPRPEKLLFLYPAGVPRDAC